MARYEGESHKSIKFYLLMPFVALLYPYSIQVTSPGVLTRTERSDPTVGEVVRDDRCPDVVFAG